MSRYGWQVVRRLALGLSVLGAIVTAGWATYHNRLAAAQAKASAEIAEGCTSYASWCGDVDKGMDVYPWVVGAVFGAIIVCGIVIGLLAYAFDRSGCHRRTCPCINHRRTVYMQGTSAGALAALAATVATITAININS